MGRGADGPADEPAGLEGRELLEDLYLVVGVEREEPDVDAWRAAEERADGPHSHVREVRVGVKAHETLRQELFVSVPI